MEWQYHRLAKYLGGMPYNRMRTGREMQRRCHVDRSCHIAAVRVHQYAKRAERVDHSCMPVAPHIRVVVVVESLSVFGRMIRRNVERMELAATKLMRATGIELSRRWSTSELEENSSVA